MKGYNSDQAPISGVVIKSTSLIAFCQIYNQVKLKFNNTFKLQLLTLERLDQALLIAPQAHPRRKRPMY